MEEFFDHSSALTYPQPRRACTRSSHRSDASAASGALYLFVNEHDRQEIHTNFEHLASKHTSEIAVMQVNSDQRPCPASARWLWRFARILWMQKSA